MKRTLRIEGHDYEVPPFIHRRFATNAWAINLPGFEMYFPDEDYGGTAAALVLAKLRLPYVLELNRTLLEQHCTIHITVRAWRDSYLAHCPMPSFSRAREKETVVEAKDTALAQAYCDYDVKLPLFSSDAVRLLGEKAHAAFVSDWISEMRSHITAVSISRTRLEHAPHPHAPAVPQTVVRRQRSTQRSLW